MNKWIQKAYAILMTCLCLFQYVGSLTQVVSADTAPADGNVGVTLRGADLNADGTQLTLKYSAQTATNNQLFCATVTGGSLTDGEQGTLKDSQGQEIGDYYVSVDSTTNKSTVNLNIAGGKNVDDATLTLPLSSSADKVTVTNNSKSSNTVTAVKPQPAAASVDLSNYMPAGQSIAKITSFSFKDAQGNDIKPDQDGTYNLPPDAQIKYDYTFEIPSNLKDNHKIQAGDYFSFDLPTTANAENSQGDLIGGLGTYEVNNNRVTITLNQNAVGDEDVKGTFEHTESAQTIVDAGYQTIKTPVTDSETRIAVDREAKTGKNISKSNEIVKSATGSELNAKQIKWYVTFNADRKLLTDASVTDPLPSGLSLNDKQPVVVEDTSSGMTLIEGKDFVLDRRKGNQVRLIGNYTKTSDAFKITYLTDIAEDKIPDDGDSLPFTNTATLHDHDQNPSASSSVSVNYGKMLQKNGNLTDQDGQIFHWTLDFNYGEKTIKAGTEVKDKLLPATPQKYYITEQNPIQVNYVTFGANGNTYSKVPSDMYKLTFDNGSFTLKWLRKMNQAVEITYDTQATIPLTDENATQLNPTNDKIPGISIGNQASTGDNVPPVTALVPGEQRELKKTLTGTNYSQKTNDWTITVNSGKQLFSYFTLTDKLPNGLKLNGIPQVTDVDTGRSLRYGTDYLVIKLGSGNAGFRLIFIGEYKKTDDKFIITYRTDFNTEANSNGTWNNQADSYWVDDHGGDHHDTQKVPFEPGTDFLNDASKSGQYDPQTKEIKWTVGVNYNQRQLQDARVTDTIPEGQTYVPGSVQVFSGKIDDSIRSGSGDDAIEHKGDDWVSPTDYTVHYDEKTKTINVDLPHDNGVYFVEFDTSLAGQLVGTTPYTNTATFVNGNEQHNVTYTFTVDHGGDYIDKSGQKDGSVVDWSVDVNPSQSTLSDVKIVDIPSRNQFVDANSVAVYEMMPNSAGKNTVYRKAVAGTDYTVSVVTDYQNTGAQVLIVKFNKTINRAYRVDYEAKINSSDDQATLSNQVSIIADHVTKTYQQKTATVIIDHDGGSASGEVGPNLRFKLTKVDGDNPSVPLAGVGFQLFMAKKSADGSGSDGYVKDGEVIRKGTTGDDGTLSWSNLKPGEYILQEDLSTTPKGYTAGAYAKGKHITIQKNDSEKDAQGNSVAVDNQTVANDEYHGEVTLTKTSQETGERLAGATYELYRDDSDTGTSATTDQNGKLHIFNLAPGKYYLQETKAPRK
jgi:uncharacterized surface anchored protein